MKIRVVVCDWDGVLCNSTESYLAHFNTVLRGRGKPELTMEEFRQKTAIRAVETFCRVGIHDASASEEFLAAASDGALPPLFSDSIDTLRWLKDREVAVYIASGHSEANILRFIRHYGLSEVIVGIRGGASPELKADFTARIIHERQMRPEEAILVDDMDEVIARAKTVGCYRVASARGFCSVERLRMAQPDKIIHHLKSLQRFINLISYQRIAMPQNGLKPPKGQSGK